MAKLSEVLLLLKDILLRPGVVVVLILYGLLQLVSNLITWTLPVKDQEKYQFIQLLNWRVWMIGTPILTVVLIGLIVRAAYQAIEKREAEHATAINKLTEEHKTDLAVRESATSVRHKSQIKWLQSRISSNYETFRERMIAHRKHYNTKVGELFNKISEQSKQLKELTKNKLIVTVIRTSSNVFAEADSTLNYSIVHARIGMRFKNLIADDIAVEDLTVTVCERDAYNNVRTLSLGRTPTTLETPAHIGIRIEQIRGLMIKGNSLSPEYTYRDEEMIVDVNRPELTNGRHFLRLILTPVVQQNPYMVDIEVDWTEPGAFIVSAKPVTD
jgi:hypothetical protein